MRAAQNRIPPQLQTPEPHEVTLLDLVQAISDEADDDLEIVATVLHLLRTGQVRLRGNFRGSGADSFG